MVWGWGWKEGTAKKKPHRTPLPPHARTSSLLYICDCINAAPVKSSMITMPRRSLSTESRDISSPRKNDIRMRSRMAGFFSDFLGMLRMIR